MKRRSALAAGGLAVGWVRSGGAHAGADDRALVVRNATLVDGSGAPAVEGATLVAVGGRISAVVGASVWDLESRTHFFPATARVLDAAGLVALPGLIDTHVHLVYGTDTPSAYLRAGVTTVRDVGNSLTTIELIRTRGRARGAPGPRIVTHGPLLDGPRSVWPGARELATEQEADRAARRVLDDGADGLKVYSALPAELMRAVVGVAAARGRPVAAHLGAAVTAREAAEMGIRSIEHGFLGARSYPMAPAERDDLIALLVRRGVFIPATLQIGHNLSTLPVDDPRVRRAAPSITQEEQRAVRGVYEEVAAFVRDFHAAGGVVTAGTDTPNVGVLPGAGLHEELERLVEDGGLTPMGAIHAATGAAAQLLGRTDLGVIREGARADLVLVEGDPLADISATRNVRLVVLDGRVVHEAGPPLDAPLA